MSALRSSTFDSILPLALPESKQVTPFTTIVKVAFAADPEMRLGGPAAAIPMGLWSQR